MIDIKKSGIIFLLSVLSHSLYSQLGEVDHWETVFNADTLFKYRTSNEGEAFVFWRDRLFDDSGWMDGKGGIGYGDGDDNTIINACASVFMRIRFDIADKSEIAAAILNIDYDDAFVAFLNGVEIARSGGLKDPFPAFNVFSTQQHDALIPEGGAPETYLLNTAILQDNLLTGSNTLAIQVHNAALTSSDMSSSTWFSVGLNSATERYLPTPAWFTPPVSVSNFSSNLPIMIIETEGGQEIQDEPKITAQMGLIDKGQGERNHVDDPFNEYNGLIGIEIRGNSTSEYPKKPYNIETRDALGDNLNLSILGMPEENDWTLRASYFDHTFIRNCLANHMSRETGRWASRTRHVEVLLNGDYMGIYILMEKLKRDKNRVDIARLDSADLTGEDLTGGYIWEITGFEDHFGESRKMKYPKIDEVLPAQLSYIQSFDNAFRSKMRSGSAVYSDPNTGYVEHIDVESFVYEVVVQEAMRNSDAYGWSGYYHKDKNGLINAGPVWDFDQSSGNSAYPDNGVVDGWLIGHPRTSNTPFYWTSLLNESFFRYSLKLRWEEMRDEKYRTEKLLAYVDSIANHLSEAQEREFTKWPVLGEDIWRETKGYSQRDTYQKEVDYLKNFLTQRWDWIDNQLDGVPEPTGYPEITIQNPINDMEEYQAVEKVYIDLDKVFYYPYSSSLKYSAFSSDTSIVLPDVKKSDSLKLNLRNIGICELAITARDTYGNQKRTSFQIEVVHSASSNADHISENEGSLRIYPVPAVHMVNIQLVGDRSSGMTLQIINLTGQTIDEIYRDSNELTAFNIDHLEEGIYIIKLRTDRGKVYTGKLIVYR